MSLAPCSRSVIEELLKYISNFYRVNIREPIPLTGPSFFQDMCRDMLLELVTNVAKYLSIFKEPEVIILRGVVLSVPLDNDLRLEVYVQRSLSEMSPYVYAGYGIHEEGEETNVVEGLNLTVYPADELNVASMLHFIENGPRSDVLTEEEEELVYSLLRPVFERALRELGYF